MSNGLVLKTEVYRAGAFIFIEGQKDPKNFYIIRSGKVRVIKEIDLQLEEEPSILGPGDFFGVVSCMSGHPRIESAQALTDVALISILRDQFGELIKKNAPVALKIIRSFSKKLRFFDSEITKRTLKKSTEEDPTYLFDIGEYYFRKGDYKKAGYVYQRFIQYCPADQRVPVAKARLAKMGLGFGPPPPPPAQGLTRTYPDDTMIFSEHEPGNELYIIQQGKVKITKIINNQEVLLAVLQEGDIFGEMALLENKPRSASAIAYGDVVLLAVNKANFEIMVVNQPQIATKLIQLLSERIWTAYKQLANLTLKDPVARMYDTLLTQILKKKIPIEPRKGYTFDFGPKELLKMIGMPEDQGAMYLRQLFENKKIQLRDNKIYVTDLEELEKQVNYYKKMQELEQKRELAAKKGF